MNQDSIRSGIGRRDFLKMSLAALCFTLLPFRLQTTNAQTAGKSTVFWVTDIPADMTGNYHAGVDNLIDIMGASGFKLYKSPSETQTSGAFGMIATDDVVLIKVNAQWKYRGCTNSDLIRGLIQRILDHPDGFTGEVVIFENGQGRGSLDCDTMGGDYPSGVHANAQDERHSFTYLVDTVFTDNRVSYYLLDPIRQTMIGHSEHQTDGYRVFENVSYPCFTTRRGNRVELREGIWDGSSYTQNLKLINVPVLKHHDTGGSEITASLKHFYGILSMADGQSSFRHYAGLGETCGKMVAFVRAPVLNIIDAIWVSHGSLAGYPRSTTTRINQIAASQDPVALDYWAAKYILYPIKGNRRHHPDFPGISAWLASAARTINEAGSLYNPEKGIIINNVTNQECDILLEHRSIAPLDATLYPVEGTIGTELVITGSQLPLPGKVLVGNVPATIEHWDYSMIRCRITKVPSVGPLHLTIHPRPYRTSSPSLISSLFTVRTPEIVYDVPYRGFPGQEIVLEGRFFGNRKGKVYIEYEKDRAQRRRGCLLKGWSMDSSTGYSTVTFRLPKTLEPGAHKIIVANKVGEAEAPLFVD